MLPAEVRQRGSAVSISHVSRRYGTGPQAVLALDDASFEIPPGAFFTVLGPSGCGKSTLLNILAGFDHCTSGEVSVDGQAITGPSSGRGVVFQDTGALFPWLTAAQNIAFGLQASGLGKPQIDARVSQILELVGLSAFGDKWPHQLSGGMRQLVAIGRVLVMDAKVLLMDEPFAALDAMTRQTMQQRLTEIWQRTGVTVLFITHSVDEAVYLGDQVVVLSGRPGRVCDLIDVDLPRPRDITSVEFNRLKARALARLGIS